MTDLTDVYLVNQCLEGNRQAFEAVIDKYQGVVYNMAFRMVNDRDDAQDIAQTVFIKVYRNLNRYNPKYKFFSWLYRIAMNETVNFLKRRRPGEPVEYHHLPGDASPETLYDRSEQHDTLQQAIGELKPDYRIVIILKHLQEFSYLEISELLNIPEKTVKSRLFTARQLLREILLKKGVHFG